MKQGRTCTGPAAPVDPPPLPVHCPHQHQLTQHGILEQLTRNPTTVWVKRTLNSPNCSTLPRAGTPGTASRCSKPHPTSLGPCRDLAQPRGTSLGSDPSGDAQGCARSGPQHVQPPWNPGASAPAAAAAGSRYVHWNQLMLPCDFWPLGIFLAICQGLPSDLLWRKQTQALTNENM